MTGKEYLLSVKRLDNMINDKLDEIYRLKTKATSITVPCDKERVQCSSSQDRQGDYISQIIDLEKDVDVLTDILIDTKRNIKTICSRMNPFYGSMIKKRYIQNMSLSQIATIYNIKIGKTKYNHKKAVEEFEKIYLTNCQKSH